MSTGLVLLLLSLTAARPSAPVVQEGICPFEYGCDFDAWVAEQPLVAYVGRGDSTQAFKIAPGDTLRYIRSDMVVDTLGIAVIRQTSYGFVSGDTVLVLSYVGEGGYDIWYRGGFRGVESFWIPPADTVSYPSARALLMRPPGMVWWVQVSNTKHQTGWLGLRNIEGSAGIDFAERIKMLGGKHGE